MRAIRGSAEWKPKLRVGDQADPAGEPFEPAVRESECEDVLPDAFAPAKVSQRQKATITIDVDGVEQTIHVDLSERPDRRLVGGYCLRFLVRSCSHLPGEHPPL